MHELLRLSDTCNATHTSVTHVQHALEGLCDFIEASDPDPGDRLVQHLWGLLICASRGLAQTVEALDGMRSLIDALREGTKA